MDTLIDTMIENSDGAISNAVAKQTVRADCAAGVVKEMGRARLPLEATESLLPLCALVNKHDLRRLTAQDPAHWPQPRGPREMMEREILRALRKAGVGNDALGVP
ncbi:hypothetical protein MAPG_11777 [Magnaporthiopsis poae ATCC 64411]|uniref:Uncharacterized protein n=1 Tax=Magnaporthiopsis poae (strain ATCC 64411 / 73-15) TaxID=644358 RepID=A0A0C4EG57_MAGP6|nr:hypothetical protein MAPG_11777 [Magnaporthiopsis poae ATCC 64411]